MLAAGQLEKHSISPRFGNLFQVPVPSSHIEHRLLSRCVVLCYRDSLLMCDTPDWERSIIKGNITSAYVAMLTLYCGSQSDYEQKEHWQ